MTSEEAKKRADVTSSRLMAGQWQMGLGDDGSQTEWWQGARQLDSRQTGSEPGRLEAQ